MQKVYNQFVKGLIAILPISITLQLVIWIASFAEDSFGNPLARVLPTGFYTTGMGIVVGFICILFVGFLINNYLAAQFFVWFENQMKRVPLFKTIYSPIRDIMNMFDGERSMGMKRVVMVEMYEGVEVVGLVTRDQFQDLEMGFDKQKTKSLLAVYVPFSFAMGGMTILVPKSKVRDTKLTPQQALQLSVTGWIKSSNSEAPDNDPNPSLPIDAKPT